MGKYGAIKDVNGSFARMVREAPKLAKRHLSTAVFQTAGVAQRRMEANAPLGPDGEGLTPGGHIKFDIERRGRTGGLSATVGLFDPDQAAVALFNEYVPNRQPFMRPASKASERKFEHEATAALVKVERALAGGFR
ncbi:hypothetical protein BH18ACI5_BH18ACI5_04410 [soil metagenome]